MDIGLAEIDRAADVLQLCFLPARTVLCLGQQERKAAHNIGGCNLANDQDEGRVYFIAEGECTVRRSTKDSGQQSNRSRCAVMQAKWL